MLWRPLRTAPRQSTLVVMIRAWAILGLGSFLLLADEAKQKVQVTHTEHFDLASGGQLSLKNSIGDVTVDGWDQPGVEITTIKSTKEDVDPRNREKAMRLLNQVQVTTEHHGDELVVTSKYPREVLPPPFLMGGAVRFDLQYQIKVPWNTRLVIQHRDGEVYLNEVLGDIRATATQGSIILHLPEDRQYAIDAKSVSGSVNSDFAGHEKLKPLLVGHQFTEDNPGAAQKLFLRIGYGDIVILKEHSPSYPGPAAK